MSEFTYTVFLVVATLIGALVALFSAGVIGVLLHDADRLPETTEVAELPRAA